MEDLQKQLLHLLAPEINEKETGKAEIIQIFSIRGEQILGCRVQTGVLRKGDLVHLKRADQLLADAKVVSLKQGKTDIDSVSENVEFGLVLDKPATVVVGDVVLAYQIVED